MKVRLDNLLFDRGMVDSRSQAENYIRLGQVRVEGRIIDKPGFFVRSDSKVNLDQRGVYVSRAALKLASVASTLKVEFRGRTVIDVGSSTGGFTDYTLRAGANKVYAVELGTKQMDVRLRSNKKVALFEKTNIMDFELTDLADMAVIDLSFISVKQVLNHVADLVKSGGDIIVMLKPQFEATPDDLVDGIVKNNKIRRQILKNFEGWCRHNKYYIKAKSDSSVAGSKGNVERFYVIKRSMS